MRSKKKKCGKIHEPLFGLQLAWALIFFLPSNICSFSDISWRCRVLRTKYLLCTSYDQAVFLCVAASKGLFFPRPSLAIFRKVLTPFGKKTWSLHCIRMWWRDAFFSERSMYTRAIRECVSLSWSSQREHCSCCCCMGMMKFITFMPRCSSVSAPAFVI